HQFAAIKAREPAFEEAVVIHRLPGYKPQLAAGEALKVGCTTQLTVEPGRRDFQRVGATRHRVFNIENSANFTAQVGAVLVRHPARLINENAQGTKLTAAPHLQFDQFQAQRISHSPGNLLNVLETPSHRLISGSRSERLPGRPVPASPK